jgi:CRP-like cAMP-binding protein
VDDHTLALLRRCHPLQHLTPESQASLLRGVTPRHYTRGQTLLKRLERNASFLTFLLTGRAELRRSFFDREPLQAGEGNTLAALELLLPESGGQIVAVDVCSTLQLPRAAIDTVLAEGSLAAESYAVANLRDADFADEFLICDGAVEADWMSRFLQSPLANHLPALTIQQLLACLASRPAARGEVLVRRGEPGEAFYVLTRGMATVRTDVGAPGEREISLIPGDYFGEESLVADTVRNATVVMEADGSVARLDRRAFDELVRPHLIPEVDAAEAVAAPVQRVDVRFPVEYRRDARPDTRNIPISLLRASLDQLEAGCRYLVTREGGRRSELAVFLLRQAGFDAYLLAH